MSNISWAKSIANWGKNESDPVIENRKSSPKEKVSPEVIQASITDILKKCDELMNLSATVYDSNANKELYDVLIHLDEARKSLKSITI